MDDLDPSKLSDRELLVQTYSNVKNMGEKLEEHILDDKDLKEKVLTPLWTKYQQTIGSEQAMSTGSKFAGYLINTAIAVIAAVGAIKVMK